MRLQNFNTTIVVITLFVTIVARAMPAQVTSVSQGCPVQIKKIDTSNGLRAGLAAAATGVSSNSFYLIDYVNNSDKDVATIRFGVGYINSMHELSGIDIVTTKELKLKPGKKHSVVGGNGWITGGENMKSVGWVQKVMFSDGTYWNDDGSKSCATASLQNAFIVEGKMTPQQMLAFSQSGEGSMTVVSTYPPGAAVSVDGKTVGVTPFSFMLLRHGSSERTITLTLAGYKPHVEHRIPDGSMIVITSSLEPDKALNR